MEESGPAKYASSLTVQRTELLGGLRHNAPVRGIRANRENVFLDGLSANRGNGFAHLGLGRTPSVTATHMVQIVLASARPCEVEARRQ